jgi:DnaK suppressor protein
MTQKKGNNSMLTTAEIREFKSLLLEKLEEILDNIVFMEEETLRKPRTDLSNMPIHMADMGTDDYEMENTLGLMDSERKLLAEIEDALARIENGTYGICEGNDEPIPKARLEAIPWARYCVACASLFEKGILVREDSFDELDYNDQTNDVQDDDFDNSTSE